DDKTDEIHHFDRYGWILRTESDDNFDGRMETSYNFLRGLWSGTESDLDGDDSVDYRAEAVQGVIASEEWLDVSGNAVKRVDYEGGIATSGEFDADKDGKLDVRRRYDRLGEIEKNTSLEPK
ncbi:MAG TPA: hypothetical protein VET30_10140, partial [Pseudoxanthomonas sp.]|nr:hypothetical protein [Pseudoxanthomonas sp.]